MARHFDIIIHGNLTVDTPGLLHNGAVAVVWKDTTVTITDTRKVILVLEDSDYWLSVAD